MTQTKDKQEFSLIRFVQRSVGPDHEYRSSVVASLIFAFLYGWLEYYYIVQSRPGLPFRYAYTPIFLGFYEYHIFPMLVIFGLVGFLPFLDDVLFMFRPQSVEKLRTGILGIANIFLAVWFEDISWFVCRMIRPLEGDPLGGKWIQVVGVDGLPEWTARMGYLALGGNAIPYWYVIAAFSLVIVYSVVFVRLRARSPAKSY
jgi:hypothetical protein